jgi:hypothetical protein
MKQDLEMLLSRAERGFVESQKMASQQILQADDYPNRYLDAVRWLLIARVLDEEAVSQDVLEYFVVSLCPTKYDEVFALAERWLAKKVENSAGEDEARWAPELRQYKYPDQDVRQTATAEMIVHWMKNGMGDETIWSDFTQMKVLPKVSGKGDWLCEFEYIGSDVSQTSDFNAYKSVLKMAQREFKLECD